MITKNCLLNIISFKHIPLKKYSIIYLNLIITGENYLLILKSNLNLVICFRKTTCMSSRSKKRKYEFNLCFKTYLPNGIIFFEMTTRSLVFVKVISLIIKARIFVIL